MRLYPIVSEFLLILPIIDFSVMAPVLAREKPQARVNVVHTSGDAVTVLGKRGNKFDMLHQVVDSESRFSPQPEELSTAHPSLSPPSSEPADRPMDVGQPLLLEKPQVSNPDRALPSLPDEWDRMWHELVQGHPSAEPESSAARPSSSSQPSGSAGESMDAEKLPPTNLAPKSRRKGPAPTVHRRFQEMNGTECGVTSCRVHRSRQPHVRLQAHSCRALLMDRWIPSNFNLNCYHLAPKSCRK